MHITVKRIKYGETYTIGELSVNGIRNCFTLEDTTRETPFAPVTDWKVPGSTAIPIGIYDVTVDFSNRFQRHMPHVLNVPGFEGVRIHSGNTADDTEGCLLVGSTWKGAGIIQDSRKAFYPLFDAINDAVKRGEPVKLEIA